MTRRRGAAGLKQSYWENATKTAEYFCQYVSIYTLKTEAAECAGSGRIYLFCNIIQALSSGSGPGKPLFFILSEKERKKT